MRLLAFSLGRQVDLFAQLTDKFLQEIRILVNFRVIPVDAAVFAVHNTAHHPAVDLGFLQHTVESQGRNGTKVGGLDAFNLAYERRIIVFTTNKQFRFRPKLYDVRSGEHQFFLDGLGRGGLGFGLGGFGGGTFGHDFLRVGNQRSTGEIVS